MKTLNELHAEWMKDPEYRREYDALGPEFEKLRAEIERRAMLNVDEQHQEDGKAV